MSMFLDADVAVSLIGDANVTIPVSTILDALRALGLAVAALMRLKIGEASSVAATLDMGIPAALPLDAGHTLLAAATPFGMLRAAAALTLDTGDPLVTTAAALDLRLALSTATALRACLTLTAATLCFGLTAPAALSLRLTTTMTALFGLCRSRSGDCHCRDTCCQDELPHHKSPIPSADKRTCLRAVPPIAGCGERLGACRLA